MEYREIEIITEDFCYDPAIVERLGDTTLQVEYEMVEEGIGAYEFWGMIGIDECLEPFVTEINHPDAAFQQYINKNFRRIANQLRDYLID
jgi:hypothetical protein